MLNPIWYIRAAFARADRPLSTMRKRRRAKLAKPRNIPKEFIHYLKPRSIGNFEVGQQLAKGHFFFAGELFEAPGTSIWAIPSPNENFTDEIHSFVWLDDLAAVGDNQSRKLAQRWLIEWTELYGKGQGWTPALAGRRVSRICSHARFLFANLDEQQTQPLFVSIARQLDYISKNWRREKSGLLRLEALAALVLAGTSFSGRRTQLKSAHRAIGAECKREIGANGEISTRNPEELMQVFTLLTRVFRTIEEAELKPNKALASALERIAPTLRGLRLGGGNLTRFHGGGRGTEGQLDQVLSDSGVRTSRLGELAMGFDRLTAARITVLVDCAPPPMHEASIHGHASTLSFEMSSGKYPLVSNCGAGMKFGPEWERVSRITAAHNTVSIGMKSSATFIKPGFVSSVFGERIIRAPKNVTRSRKSDMQGNWLIATHDGYTHDFGLTHQRRLFLSPDGRELRGQDELSAESEKDRKQFDAVNNRNQKLGINYSAHFHIHPDVTVIISEAGQVVTLTLPNQEEWRFRQEGGQLSLEESIYLDQWRLKPRATKQIVVSGKVLRYGDRISWIFKRTKDSAPITAAPRDRSLNE